MTPFEIAFHAPMKPPDHATPSGDRQLARLLLTALDLKGHRCRVASDLRTWRKTPPEDDEMEVQAATEHKRLLGHYARNGAPDVWLTYHLYHKAPDLLGPEITQALGIPYVVVEASRAERHRTSEWAWGFAKADAALAEANRVAYLHTVDRAGLEAHPAGLDLTHLPPFLDTAHFRPAKPKDGPCRLLTVAMMREGDKAGSYRVLAEALRSITHLDWTLTLVGDGPMRAEIEALFPEHRTRFVGAMPPETLPDLYADADLFVWPGMREAFGLVYLEAQASGLPIVGGNGWGVRDVVRHGVTGLLCDPGEAAAHSAAIAALIGDPVRRHAMGEAARAHVMANHSLEAGANILDDMLKGVLA